LADIDQWQTVIATNGKFTEKTKIAARDSGVKLLGPRELDALLAKYPITFAEIEAAERKRCKSIRDVKSALRAWQ